MTDNPGTRLDTTNPPPRGTADVPLVQLIKEDWIAHHRRALLPGFHAMVVHRIGVWARQQPWVVRKPLGLFYEVVNTVLIRGVYGVEIARTTRIGRRVCIGHHQGVVLGTSAVIGDDCLIRQNVTLGQSNDEHRENDMPVVGNDVQFGAGAIVIGPVRIGDGARIGPGAVVSRNVPAGATAFAPPARTIAPPDPG